MKETDKIVELITGNVAEELKSDILSQVKSDAQFRKEYSSVKNAWALSESLIGMSELKIERAYFSFKKRIEGQRQTISVRLFSFLKYAAILLIVFGAGILSKKYLMDKVGGTQTTEGKLTEFVVPSGQVAEVSLPDGSHVWLNAETRLSFPGHFTDEAREVTLEGEAYFKIQKGKIPFVVSTKFGEIVVLGTSFNVRAFENSEFQTTLVEGTIKYKNPEQHREVTLSPGQQLALSKDRGIQVHEVKTDLYTSWKDGVIIFRSESLRNVMHQLERHFAVKIQLEGDLIGEIRFTGSIKNESLVEVMEYIDKTEPIQYSYDEKRRLLIVKQK